MPARRTFASLIALLAALWALEAHAGKSTVCTVTVNSPNEKETLRRVLPEDKFQFVELVERGRPDWLASACRQNLRCDVLVISGHFDGGTEFYSDRLDARESLPVAEMERASCSASCSGLFLAAEGSLSLRLQHAERRDARQHRGGSRAQPRALRLFARRRRARLARLERAARRKQSRWHATHIRQRSGHLRLFRDGAAGRGGGAAARPPPAIVRRRRIRQRSRQREPARPVRRELDDRHRGNGRCRSACRLSSRGLPILRRAAFAGAEARLHPSNPAAATWPRCACSSSASRHFTRR